MRKLKDFIIWFANSYELHSPLLRIILLIIAVQYTINSFFYSLGDSWIVILIKVLFTGINFSILLLVIGALIDLYKEENKWKNL